MRCFDPWWAAKSAAAILKATGWFVGSHLNTLPTCQAQSYPRPQQSVACLPVLHALMWLRILLSCLQCKQPSYIQLEYDQILVNTNSSFVLQSRSSGITLKGQMLPTTVQQPGEKDLNLLGKVFASATHVYVQA